MAFPVHGFGCKKGEKKFFGKKSATRR